MTWIVWRQQRPVLITLAVGLVVGAATILLLRMLMINDINARNLLDCVAKGIDACQGSAVREFQNSWFDVMHVALAGMLVLPLLVGLFVGAPLFAREYEQGTHTLAFTQSVSRTRWMVTKFVVAGLPALVAVGVAQVVVRSWLLAAGKLGPFAAGPFYLTNFEGSGVSPIAYTVFAYTLGMFAGALFRRTLVAMTLTLVIFVAARFVLNGVRRLMLTPTRVVYDDPIDYRIERGPLYVDGGYLTPSGAEVDPASVSGKLNCAGRSYNTGDLVACYREHGLVKAYVDQIPVNQVMTLHLVEASIFAGAAVLFVLGSVWAVRRQV
ncbi:ABC transporter permease subunit [Lentzea sp. NPDC051838]|uniref:ABC transporter permease subunit n=1 Tax=Lentzea sp. NPDC051838 TaxID=3154849 RepID=UPI003440482E